ncbi:head completion/stabilization protein [Paraburkholderia fungorum]|uniref:head completion/stabilization protein n=1 Tax=Paraburkholderia fungorum TaxID=134537 RepID=UPI0004AB10CF|nr:head completion/stabilization protein [Paraburkholderia fungorum]KFX61018.1 phage head protein [Burkholderia sp. K24]USX10516.1 head completion/stabilization protein [Paraburkholderia fungorum]
MSSFLATAEPNTPQTPGSPANVAIVENDGWFPDIDMNALRASMRLDGTATHERLRDATIDAIASINAELGAWKANHIAAGYADLVAVPAPRIGGESVQLARYRRAVFNLAHADLTERYRDFDSTKSGGQKAEDLEMTICEARRNIRWALSDMRGLPRSTIELI